MRLRQLALAKRMHWTLCKWKEMGVIAPQEETSTS
jgi:hypothetical protein